MEKKEKEGKKERKKPNTQTLLVRPSSHLPPITLKKDTCQSGGEDGRRGGRRGVRREGSNIRLKEEEELV